MDYKKVIDEQIKTLQKRQINIVEGCSSRDDIVCLYANTISKLAEIASNINVPLSKVNKEVEQNGKE